MTKGDRKTFLTDVWSLASPIAYHCKNAKEHGTSQWFGGGLILQKSKMNQIHILTLDWFTGFTLYAWVFPLPSALLW